MRTKAEGRRSSEEEGDEISLAMNFLNHDDASRGVGLVLPRNGYVVFCLLR